MAKIESPSCEIVWPVHSSAKLRLISTRSGLGRSSVNLYLSVGNLWPAAPLGLPLICRQHLQRLRVGHEGESRGAGHVDHADTDGGLPLILDEGLGLRNRAGMRIQKALHHRLRPQQGCYGDLA